VYVIKDERNESNALIYTKYDKVYGNGKNQFGILGLGHYTKNR
jgi:hypothetical protein